MFIYFRFIKELMLANSHLNVLTVTSVTRTRSLVCIMRTLIHEKENTSVIFVVRNIYSTATCLAINSFMIKHINLSSANIAMLVSGLILVTGHMYLRSTRKPNWPLVVEWFSRANIVENILLTPLTCSHIFIGTPEKNLTNAILVGKNLMTRVTCGSISIHMVIRKLFSVTCVRKLSHRDDASDRILKVMVSLIIQKDCANFNQIRKWRSRY